MVFFNFKSLLVPRCVFVLQLPVIRCCRLCGLSSTQPVAGTCTCASSISSTSIFHLVHRFLLRPELAVPTICQVPPFVKSAFPRSQVYHRLHFLLPLRRTRSSSLSRPLLGYRLRIASFPLPTIQQRVQNGGDGTKKCEACSTVTGHYYIERICG